MDESMAVSKSLKISDIQSAAVILDFKKLRVEKASLNGTVIDRDWDKIMSYYYQYYKNTIDRLLVENGYEIVQPKPEENNEEEKSNHTD